MRNNLFFLFLFTWFLSACTKDEDNNENDRVNPGTVKDASDNIYRTVKIGKQVWMAENLRTTKYRDGSNITLQTDDVLWENYDYINNINTRIPMMCWYQNDQTTYSDNKFGALYNWYVISASTNGNKQICPNGWHVPTDDEWGTLINYLGGEMVAGGRMKSTGTQYWQTQNTTPADTVGFAGLPGGYRGQNGKFYNLGIEANWWSSSSQWPEKSWRFSLDDYGSYINRGTGGNGNGFSVRCIMD